MIQNNLLDSVYFYDTSPTHLYNQLLLKAVQTNNLKERESPINQINI